METEPYRAQCARWPAHGRHILAHFDDDAIVVYQAYRPAIADHAVAHQTFGGEFSWSRMSWIKPNFLWMMHRCGWAAKEGQERVLAVRIPRPFFDDLLRAAVPSSFHARRYATPEAWQQAVAASAVRLQWDPDHDPSGRPLARRAIQLGLRGDALRAYGDERVLSIEDITPFVLAQRDHARAPFDRLQVPRERVYVPAADAAAAVGLDAPPPA